MIAALWERLLEKRPAEGGIWRGALSSSAISTSVAVFALHLTDREKYAPYIQRGADWLSGTMRPDGSWGDSVESPSNMTATLLSYAALSAVSEAPQQAQAYLTEKFGGLTDRQMVKGVLDYYGKDLTFSAPILVMCALAGVIAGWEKIPQLPFEVSVLPQKLFRFFRLIDVHEPLLVDVEEGAAVAAAPFGHQDVRGHDAGRVELDEFHVARKALRPVNHCYAVARSHLRVGGGVVDVAHAARRKNREARAESFDATRLQVENVGPEADYLFAVLGHYLTQMMLC